MQASSPLDRRDLCSKEKKNKEGILHFNAANEGVGDRQHKPREAGFSSRWAELKTVAVYYVRHVRNYWDQPCLGGRFLSVITSVIENTVFG